MQTVLKSPFEGEPETIQGVAEDGTAFIQVHAKPITPGGAMIGDFFAVMTRLHMIAVGSAVFFEPVPAPEDYVVSALLFGAALFAGRTIRRWARDFYGRRKTTVAFTQRTFSIMRAGNKVEVFDRMLQHSFALVSHDRAQEERDKLDSDRDAARAKGQAFLPTRYYSDS